MVNIGDLVLFNDREFDQDDFLHTTGPYEAVYRYKEDPFKHQQAIAAMSQYAKGVKVNNFTKLYKAYCTALQRQQNTFVQCGVTDFEDQPLELNTGEWEADDRGITRQVGDTEELACPHPILPVERLVNVDTRIEKLKLAYRKGHTAWRELIVDKSVVASSQRVVALADRGIAVNSESAKPFVRYIFDLENLNYDAIPERKSIGRLGHIPGEGFSPYVDGLVFDGESSFQSLFDAVRTAGDRETWLAIARECRTMSTTAKVVLAASFASPLLEILGSLPFFVHLWGVDSGTGKTVALMLAASVWANPEVGKYIKTFDATVVGQEKTAAFLNSLPYCLDELQLAKDSKGIQKFDVYKLAQGTGRTRGNKNGGVDKISTWHNCILTTGESPITSDRAGAGAVNRVIDIECKASQVVIVDGQRVSAALKANFGHIGREYIEKLYADPAAQETIKTGYRSIFKHLCQSDTTEKQAMAAAAILVADELATEWFFQDGNGLTLEEMAEFLASKATVSAGERGYQYLCDWVAENSNRFNSSSERPGDVFGKIEHNEAFIIKKVFDEAAATGGFSPRALLSWLKSNGKIRTDDGPHNTKVTRVNGIISRCVCLELVEFQDEGELLP